MPISFHCEKCSNKIKAPDNAGGKWGQCPFCKAKCYIPLPQSDNEPQLCLAPLDESEETKYGQLMRETFSLTQQILHEKDIPDEPGAKHEQMSERDMTRNIVFYIRNTVDGELEKAAQLAKKLAPYKSNVTRIIERMQLAGMPEPELEDIAPPVLNGLLKSLKESL